MKATRPGSGKGRDHSSTDDVTSPHMALKRTVPSGGRPNRAQEAPTTQLGDKSRVRGQPPAEAARVSQKSDSNSCYGWFQQDVRCVDQFLTTPTQTNSFFVSSRQSKFVRKISVDKLVVQWGMVFLIETTKALQLIKRRKDRSLIFGIDLKGVNSQPRPLAR